MSGKAVAALSPNDPTSYSNPEDVYAEKLEMRWTVDFKTKTFAGSTTYYIVRKNPKTEHIILDMKDLKIKSISSKPNNKTLEYKLGDEIKAFGKPLKIKLPELDKNQKCIFAIEYETTGSCCLLWLPRELTQDKNFPYVFSQGQAINMRSVMPCQDTPSTKAPYYAEVTAPKEFLVLMSAMSKGDPVIEGPNAKYTFEQTVPVPAYLIAIVVAKLGSKKIGPRTTVYTEPSMVEAAGYEFGEVEQMIQTAEKLVGKYVWGDYNILVLPSSFPFGGMENPCLTFATPALLAGDRSLTDVVAHEIAHSWTGNLVTVRTFEHFWLSEGFTVYLERRMLGLMHGEPYRQFQAIVGWKTLKDAIERMGATSPDTKLVPDLKGLNPDEVFSEVPYEKGFTFLYYLEKKVGGMDEFGLYLKYFVETNKFKSIDTNTFKKQFIDYFTKLNKTKEIADIEWDKWFYTPGMPAKENTYDNQIGQACVDLKNKWKEWNPTTSSPFTAKDLDKFTIRSPQIQEFLSLIIDDKPPFELAKVKALQAAYNFNNIKNCEIKFRWLRICIRARWIDQLPLALAFLTEYGRQRYLVPIYGELFEWEAAKKQTMETYGKTKVAMLPSTQNAIEKVLKIDRKSIGKK